MIPNQPIWLRDKLRNALFLFRHCKKCTALSGCYFIERIMPKYPSHYIATIILKHFYNDSVFTLWQVIYFIIVCICQFYKIKSFHIVTSPENGVIFCILLNDYDIVELSVEKERYTQDGIHKGAIGCVMDSNAVDDYILVDFSWYIKKSLNL